MGQRVKNFGDFVLLKESVNQIESAHPSKWKVLQDLGFYDASTLRIKANGNILLKNDRFNYYPEGIVLQPNSGYVRNKGVKSGFIKKDLNLDQMIDYLITRFEKYEGETASDVSPELVTIFKRMTRGNTIKNSDTGRFDFSGNVELTPKLLDILKENKAKIGVVGGEFSFRSSTQYQLTKEDLEFFPTLVKKAIWITSVDCVGFSDLSLFPKGGSGIRLFQVMGLKSMEGIKIKGGEDSTISIKECVDLESLGTSLPEVVGDFELVSQKNNLKIKSMEGCPKRIRQDFLFRATGISSLAGGPQEVGRIYDVESNPRLTSLEHFPLDFEGRFRSMIISCKFSLYDRIRIVEEGIAVSDGWSGSEFEVYPVQKEFVATSISPKVMQKLVDENPEKMAVSLKGVLKNPRFKELKWPESLKGEVDLLSDLEDVGL
jgi:hypothetical protein